MFIKNHYSGKIGWNAENSIYDVDSVARLESFGALKLTLLESLGP